MALGIAREIRIAVTPAEEKRLASARAVDSEAHEWVEIYLSLLEGRYEESIGHLKQARELDPLNSHVKTRLGYVYYYLRDFDRAFEQFQEIVAFDPHNPLGHFGLMDVFGIKGMYDQAIGKGEMLLESGDALSPDPRYRPLLKKMGLEHMFDKVSSYKK